jgi:phosphatidate cytidylyltransferase
VNWIGFRSRILLVAVAFPVLGALILAVPHLHHFGFNLVVIGASVIGALETAALFRAKKIPVSPAFAAALSATLPVATYLEIAGILPAGWLGVWLPAAFGILLVRTVLVRTEKQLGTILAMSSSSYFAFLYPGFFLSWLVRLSSLPDASLSILFFLCLVFGNDSSAYFAGSLWGRKSRLGLPVSPQKSVVGFAAGFAGSLIVVLLFHFIVPGFPRFGLPLALALGCATAVTANLGDLLESGLKRSAGIKDSGIVIPARGGMLDSVDSMLLTAPLFYYFFILAGG